MKHFRLVLIIACFSIICTLFSGVASALEQDDLMVSLVWSSQMLYQGSSVNVRIFLISNFSQELTISYVGLHFDWMESNHFMGHDLSDDPVTVPSYGTHAFDPINILIPEDASIGAHTYFVGIDGLQAGSLNFSWDSPIQTLLINNPGEEVYSELLTKIASNIAEAVNATYQSPEAQSLLQQAENAYAQAISLANRENWEEAISALQNASTYLEQAKAEERNYIKPQDQPDLLPIIVGVIAIAAVAVLIIALLIRRKRKQTTPNNQPAET
jgi:hypothetical protein